MNQTILKAFLRSRRHTLGIHGCINRFKSTSTRFVCEQLDKRSLIRIAGRDTSEFLQGIITNDIEQLKNESGNILYSMMLNRQGRVLYDIMVYRKNAEDGHDYVIECDETARENIIKMLKMYKMRKTLDISPIDDIKLWSILKADEQLASKQSEQTPHEFPSVLCKNISHQQTHLIEEFRKVCKVNLEDIYHDPRLTCLGARLHILSTTDLGDILQNGVMLADDERAYTKYRYRLGVPEGVDDLPSEKSLPLESNLDFLHGVSFLKGCYVGQELTARTHHTGVIRKRLMPFYLRDSNALLDIQLDSVIENEKGKSVGKFRNNFRTNGLALIRLQEAFKANTLKLMPCGAEVILKKPTWWPKEKGDIPA